MLQSLDLKEADAVVVPGGRIGMISRLLYYTPPGLGTMRQVSWVWVQFGARGPFARYKPYSLRWATVKEVKDAGMYGTGFNIRIPHEYPSQERIRLGRKKKEQRNVT
jgi:hypothetical protein